MGKKSRNRKGNKRSGSVDSWGDRKEECGNHFGSSNQCYCNGHHHQKHKHESHVPDKNENHIYDAIIVGAGPHGLAALSALHENRNYDDFNDSQFGRQMNFDKVSKANAQDVCVIDPTGGWMSTWITKFRALGIKELRSPTIAHPDLFSQDSLFEYAVKNNRYNEINNPDFVYERQHKKVAGRNRLYLDGLAEKHNGQLGLPSNDLFVDFCLHLAGRLPHTLKKGYASTITKDDSFLEEHTSDNVHQNVYKVTLDNGECVRAKKIIIAVGHEIVPNIPVAFQQFFQPGSAKSSNNNITHSSNLPKDLNSCKDSNVLIIGGGLSAAQAALVSASNKKNVKTVLMSRRPLHERDFDLPLDWFDRRTNNILRKGFRDTPDLEKAKFIRDTRGGGSVPRSYLKRLAANTTNLQRRIGQVENVEVVDNKIIVDGEEFDRVVLATGCAMNVQKVKLFQHLYDQYPIDIIDGLPLLDNTLRWTSSEDIFVVGGFAALRIGPDSLNLMGARLCASILSSEVHQHQEGLSNAFEEEQFRPMHRFDVFELSKTTGKNKVTQNNMFYMSESESESDAESEACSCPCDVCESLREASICDEFEEKDDDDDAFSNVECDIDNTKCIDCNELLEIDYFRGDVKQTSSFTESSSTVGCDCCP